jgi:uncharacterized protein with von Willebrand factor type A (vWA) domain
VRLAGLCRGRPIRVHRRPATGGGASRRPRRRTPSRRPRRSGWGSDDFRHALPATLVKETRDLPTFERIFDLYFFDLKGLGAEAAKALGREDPWARGLLERLLEQRDDLDLDPLAEMLLLSDASSLELAIRQGGRGMGLERLFYFLQVGYFTRRIWDQFPWQEIEADLEALLRAAEEQGMDPGALARLRTYMELRLEAFRRLVRQHVERSWPGAGTARRTVSAGISWPRSRLHAVR